MTTDIRHLNSSNMPAAMNGIQPPISVKCLKNRSNHAVWQEFRIRCVSILPSISQKIKAPIQITIKGSKKYFSDLIITMSIVNS